MNDALRKRVVTAVVLAVGLLAVVLLMPPVATTVVVTAAVLVGAWEWSAFLRASHVALRVGYVAVVAVLLLLVWQFTKIESGLDIVLAAAVVWWVIALCWVALAPRRVAPWSASIAGILALVPAWLALVRLRSDFDRGAEWLLFAFVLVWVADIGAFFVGRRFGRLRLAPNVSPGKTWEGVLGGAALGTIVALLGASRFGIPAELFVPLCLAVVGFSVVGDLTESLFKRFAGLKDSGTLFPGHGGVMDRIDSVTGAAPVLLFGLIALGVEG
ncbi:MAG TPA: phosphatidate cytidylyltransferase [Steroidobacteraceae bacterium]